MKKSDQKSTALDWSKLDDKLVEVIEKGAKDEVNKLITKRKVNPTKVDPSRGLTALHLAVCEGKIDLVNILLSARPIDIDVRDFTGRTPLHCAVRNAEYEITQALLQQEASVALVDHELLSVLHHACLGGHLGCVQLLLSCQAPVYMQDRNGRSALSYAAWKGQASVCRLLIENGADVNDTDCDRRSPLMLAAEKGNAAVCDYLISKGANLKQPDKTGRDALWFARKFHHAEVVRVLENALKNNFPSKDGQDERPESAVYETAGDGEQSSGEEGEARAGSTGSRTADSIEFFGQTIGTFSTQREEGRDQEIHEDLEDEEDLDLTEQRVAYVDYADSRMEPAESFSEEYVDLEGGQAVAYVEPSSPRDLSAQEEGPYVPDSPQGSRREPRQVSHGTGSPSVSPPLSPLVRRPASRHSNGSSGSSRGSSRRSRASVSSVRQAYQVRQIGSDSADQASEPTHSRIIRPFSNIGDVSKIGVEELESSQYDEEDDSKRISSDSTDQFESPRMKSTERDDQTSEDISQEEISETQGDVSGSYGYILEDRAALGKLAKSSDDSDVESVTDVKSLKDLAKLKAATDLNYDDQQLMEFLDNRSLLQQEMNSLLEEKRELIDSCAELERKLSVAMRKQHWLHEELCELQIYVKEARSDIDVDRNRPAVSTDADHDIVELLLATSNKMLHVQRRIETLIRLETELIEEVDIYSSVSQTKPSTDSATQTATATLESTATQANILLKAGQVVDEALRQQEATETIAKLEKQNKSFLKQLRQAQKENRELQDQMEEVEKMIVLARELREENQAMIADYRKLRDMQEDENAELEELEQIFRDTNEENNQLITENDRLRAKLQELEKKLDSDSTGAKETASQALERSALQREISELREAVNKQSDTIQKIDETVRESNKYVVRAGEEEAVSRSITSSQIVEQMEAGGELRKQLEKVRQEYDEMTSHVTSMHSTLDSKNSEIFRLNQQILKLSSRGQTRDTTCQTSPKEERKEFKLSESTWQKESGREEKEFNISQSHWQREAGGWIKKEKDGSASQILGKKGKHDEDGADGRSTPRRQERDVYGGMHMAPKDQKATGFGSFASGSSAKSKHEGQKGQKAMASLEHEPGRKGTNSNSDDSDSSKEAATYAEAGSEDYRQEDLWIYLQQSLREAEKVLQMNKRLKEKLRELSGRSQAGPSSAQSVQTEEEKANVAKNIELQKRIEELELESTALKRTISEQGRYLQVMQVSGDRGSTETTSGGDIVDRSGIHSLSSGERLETGYQQQSLHDQQSAAEQAPRRAERPQRRSRNGFRTSEMVIQPISDENVSQLQGYPESYHYQGSELHGLPEITQYHGQITHDHGGVLSFAQVAQSPIVTSSVLSFSKQSLISQAQIIPTSGDQVKTINGKTVSTTLNVTISSLNMAARQKSISVYSEPAFKPIQAVTFPFTVRSKVDAETSVDLGEDDSTELQSVKEENANLRKEIEVLRKTWFEYDSVIDEERQRFAVELRKMRTNLEEISEENMRKASQVHELSDLSDKQKDELTRLTELRAQCNTIINDYEDLLSFLEGQKIVTKTEGFQGETADKFAAVRSYIARLTEERKAIDDAVEENKFLKQELHMLREKIESKESADSAAGSDEKLVIAEMKVNLTQLQQSFEDKCEELRQLMTRYEDAIEEKLNLQSDVHSMQERLTVSETNAKNLLNQLKEDQEEARIKMEELQRELEESKEKELERLRMIEKQREDTSKEEELSEEVERLSQEREELKTEMERQKNQTEEVRRKLMENVESLRWKLEDVERRAESKCSQLVSEQETLRNENERLKLEVADFERDFADVERLFEEEREESYRKRLLLEEELKRYTEAGADIPDIAAIRENLLRENETLREDLDKVIKEKEDIDMHFKRLEQRYKHLEDYSNELENESSQAADEKEQLTAKLEESQKNFRTVESSLKNRLADLEHRNEQLLQENKYLMQILEEEDAMKAEEKQSKLAAPVEIVSGSKISKTEMTKPNFTEASSQTEPVESLEVMDIPIKVQAVEAVKGDIEQGIHDGIQTELMRLSNLNEELLKENKLLKRDLARSREKPYSPVITWSIGLQTELEEALELWTQEDSSDEEHEIKRLRSANRDLHLQAMHLQNFLNERTPWSDRHFGGESILAERPQQQRQQQQEWRQQQNKMRALCEEHIRLMNQGSETERLYDELIGSTWSSRGRRQERLRERGLEEVSRRRAELLDRLEEDGLKLRLFIEKLESEIDSSYQQLATPTPHYPWASIDSGLPTEQVSPSGEHLASESGQAAWRPVEHSLDTQHYDKHLEQEEFQDIICSYRRHLLASVQGRIDPNVKEALMRIVQLRQRQRRPHWQQL